MVRLALFVLFVFWLHAAARWGLAALRPTVEFTWKWGEE